MLWYDLMHCVMSIISSLSNIFHACSKLYIRLCNEYFNAVACKNGSEALWALLTADTLLKKLFVYNFNASSSHVSRGIRRLSLLRTLHLTFRVSYCNVCCGCAWRLSKIALCHYRRRKHRGFFATSKLWPVFCEFLPRLGLIGAAINVIMDVT